MPTLPKASTLIRAADHAGLGAIVRKYWTRALADGYAAAGDFLGMDIPFNPKDKSTARILAAVAERVTKIEETTRDRLKAYVQIGLNEGMSIQDLARLIRDDPSAAFKPQRARLIARTETGTALNVASVNGYRASGRVTKVVVHDGDGSGDTDDACVMANGQEWTLDEAEANPLEHPACTRSFSAVVDLD